MKFYFNEELIEIETDGFGFEGEGVPPQRVEVESATKTVEDFCIDFCNSDLSFNRMIKTHPEYTYDECLGEETNYLGKDLFDEVLFYIKYNLRYDLETYKRVTEKSKISLNDINGLKKIDYIYDTWKFRSADIEENLPVIANLYTMSKVEYDMLAESTYSSDIRMSIAKNPLKTGKKARYTARLERFFHKLFGSYQSDDYRDYNEFYKDPVCYRILSDGSTSIDPVRRCMAALAGKRQDKFVKFINDLADDGYSDNQIVIILIMYDDILRHIEEYKDGSAERPIPTNAIVDGLIDILYRYDNITQEELDAMEPPKVPFIEVVKQELASEDYNPYERAHKSNIEIAFEDKFNYIPKCINLIKNLISSGVVSEKEVIENFNRSAVSKVAKLGNPALILMTLCIDYNSLTKAQREIIECYLIGDGFDERLNIKYLSNILLDAKDWSNDLLIKFISNIGYLKKEEILENMAREDFNAKEYIVDYILYMKARQDRESYEEDYSYEFDDNTIEIKGADIESKLGGLTAHILDAKDLRNFTVGYDTECCMHYDGAGENCIYMATSEPLSGIWVIDNSARDVLAQAFVWVDKEKDTLVFDNIEFKSSSIVKKSLPLIYDWVSKTPYTNVHMGTGYNEDCTEEIRNIQIEDIDISGKEMAEMPECDEDIYSDYDEDAVALKRNNKMTFEI